MLNVRLFSRLMSATAATISFVGFAVEVIASIPDITTGKNTKIIGSYPPNFVGSPERINARFKAKKTEVLGGLSQFVEGSFFSRQSERLLITQNPTIESRLTILNGAWEGSYHCSQGITRLRLVIEAKSTTDIDAVFIFSAHPKNPSVPSGSFRMEGIYNTFNSPEIPDQLNLTATTWINRPSNYQTVDLIGNVYLNEERIMGEIPNHIGCSRFDVTKVESFR